MHARQRLMGIAAALALGLALLQPPSGAAAEDKKQNQESTPCEGERCWIIVESISIP